MKCFLLFTAFNLLILSAKSQSQKEPERPNIILIMADDLGYETIGCNGGTSYQTPHLNKLAAEGVRFENAYATPLCTPTRVQLMTGKYNFRNYERFGYLNPKERTFAHLMKEAGYKTFIAGKWQLSGGKEAPYNFGFDHYCLWQLESGDFWSRYKDPVIYENGEKIKDVKGKYGPDYFTDFVLSSIESHQKQDGPFFIYYPMALVHDPFQPTPVDSGFDDYQIVGLNDTAYFKNMVAYMDELVGKVVQKLEELELRENTLIIFTGDNGTDRDVVSYMGTQKIRGDKGYTTKAGTHVPLIISWKGNGKIGVTTEALVDFTDFLPTMAEVAGIAIPDDWIYDGQSFLHQVTGKVGYQRDWIFCDYNARGRDFPIKQYSQNRDWKLYKDGSFFHFQEDPKEQNPLTKEELKGAALRSYNILDSVIKRYATLNKE